MKTYETRLPYGKRKGKNVLKALKTISAMSYIQDNFILAMNGTSLTNALKPSVSSKKLK